jgi:hypothetical protein
MLPGITLAVAAGFFRVPGLRTLTTHWPPWAKLLAAPIGALLVWSMLTFIIAFLQAPWSLLADSEKDNQQLRDTLAQMKLGLAPEVSDELELLQAHSRLTEDQFMEDNLPMSILKLKKLKYTLSIVLRTKTDIPQPILDVRCGSPIFKVKARYYNPATKSTAVLGEMAMEDGRIRIMNDRAVISLNNQALPRNIEIYLSIYTPTPTHLVSVSIGDGA